MKADESSWSMKASAGRASLGLVVTALPLLFTALSKPDSRLADVGIMATFKIMRCSAH